ncbi:MAG: efflux RND transporter periplasmic adaptor subunit [Verrucomicrobiae bacterium]|nr:efflux RND transporter periplasmic adaptor subunit [Verrucomicrobiae bacterium]
MKAVKWIIVLALLAAAGFAGVQYFQSNKKNGKGTQFKTAEITRGDIIATITATGVIEPEELVDVGAQVAGRIIAFGKDKNGNLVDYGSEVEEGMILAYIDDSIYSAEVEMATAQLAQAKAAQLKAEADLQQFQAKLEQARRDWERAQKLGPSEALSPSAYDSYKAAYEIALANVAVGKASIEQAKAAVEQSTASLSRAKRNLSYCVIKSPVKGVIIDRKVDIGQTVVASLNAPSLFLIAKDLKKIQVWVAVNEADVGMIYPGMPVHFTVDAFPGLEFHGEVRKIRLNATMTQNVVTYTVEVSTENPDQKLLPYLTANVQFETGKRTNVLMVPNAAIRWTPKEEYISPAFKQKVGETQMSSNGERKKQRPQPDAVASKFREATVWIEKGGFVEPIKVLAGLTDGSFTEIQGDAISEGIKIVVGEQIAQVDNTAGGTSSPFIPRMTRQRPGGATGGGTTPGAGGSGAGQRGGSFGGGRM